MYVKGEGGLPQDDVEAVKWYRLAADQGVEVAQYNLGMKYSLGRGVPKNYIQAYMWLRLAADQEYEKAKWQIYFIEGRMTSEQKEEALNLARNWKSKK